MLFCFAALLACGATVAVRMADAADTAPGAGARSLTLAVHEQRELPVSGTLERVAVADPEIADIVVLKGSGGRRGSVLVVGKKAGTTQVSTWPRGGEATRWEVHVQGNLQSALGDTGTASVDARGGAAVIKGHTNTLIEHSGLQAAAVDATGKGGVVVDRSTVGDTGVVQVDVKIVEVNRNILNQLGVDFTAQHNSPSGGFGVISTLGTGAFGSGGTSTSSFGSFFGSITRGAFNLSAKINLLQSNGLGRVLAAPSLVALSGQSASFLAGGELPVPQSGGLGTTTIVYKSFGVGLTVTPTILSPNRIALKVAPEASDLDYTNAVVIASTQIPAITTRRADTTVELGDGESFIIGGLISRTTTAAVDKVPLLGDLPLIGSFFRNLKYNSIEKELVIIVTPHLVKPVSRDVTLPLPGDTREKRPGPVWGEYLMGVASDSELPGFSK
ncbi:type II and III secretion system protein family protein [Pandoraea sputorum]|uniref:type II and III secretion system protein family protein n=1 Tax=Pandoraea sputorum TaxID=93222 RepID=UPI001E620265|nr:type II and III secretion system protein family protein [Pandoraea sputorum]MCE4059938.1 type II and III secretion system protein family protein [Pandoraea sputorum]